MTEEELRVHLDEFRSQIVIDSDRLEEECRYQPALYQRVGDVAAEARKDAKIAKEHVDFVKAKLNSDMRANPEKYDLPKVTDKGVDSAVQAHPETQDAISEAIEAGRVADSLGVLQESVHQRRAMLKCMVDLYTTSYFNTGDFTTKRKNAEAGIEEIVEFRNRNRSRDKDDDDDCDMEIYE